MHTKREIEEDIRKVFGRETGLISEKQFREYTGFGRDRTKTVLLGLPSWGNKRGRRYAVVDIAERLQKYSKYY